MKAFWERLTERERLFVRVGAAAVAVLALLQLVIGPALGWRAKAAERRDRAEELYGLVAEASANRGAVAAGEGADLETPILNVMTATTGRFQIQMNYRNAREGGGVETNVAASPARLFDWLHALERDYGVVVASADIARSAKGDDVQAQLTLVRRSAP